MQCVPPGIFHLKTDIKKHSTEKEKQQRDYDINLTEQMAFGEKNKHSREIRN